MNDDLILTGRGLVKRYGRVTALDKADFDLKNVVLIKEVSKPKENIRNVKFEDGEVKYEVMTYE